MLDFALNHNIIRVLQGIHPPRTALVADPGFPRGSANLKEREAPTYYSVKGSTHPGQP